MNISFKHPHLRGANLLAGAALAALLAGCNSANAPSTTASSANTSVSQNEAAPQGSSAAQSAAKTGDDHGHASDAEALEAHPHSTKLLFASKPTAIPAGKTTTWTLQINDAKSGEPVKEFDVVHDKLMHLIVVSRDLTWFNHIHPTYKGNGTFTMTTTLPRAGTYKLYADYTPKGKEQEVAPHEFSTAGASPTTNVSLSPDKMNGVWMTKKVTAHPEGEPNAKGGPTYEVALMPMPFPAKAGADTMLHFQVRDAKGVPVKDLQPYLGAMGHAVVLSSDSKQYLHSHPMEGGMDGKPHDMSKMGEMKHSAPPKSGGPDVMFHTKLPSTGLYKAWGQFMHKGQIITAAFVLNAEPGAASATATTNAPHEHKPGDPPHAH